MSVKIQKTPVPAKTISEVSEVQPESFKQFVEQKREFLKVMETATDDRIRGARSAQWACAA